MSRNLYILRMLVVNLEWYLVATLHKYRSVDNWRTLIRMHILRKEGNLPIPDYWDVTVDCGFSVKWYRCRKCDTCLGFFNSFKW